MKTVNTYYQNFEKLKEFMIEHHLFGRVMLIQVFIGNLSDEYILQVTGDLGLLSPDSTIIGTTTAGEIMNGKTSENNTVISFTYFDSTKLKSTYIDSDSEDYFQMGVNIANELITKTSKAIILFSDTLHANREDLLKGIESVKKTLIVAGGVAGDNFKIVGGKVFLGSKIISNGSGIVAVSLNSESLNIYTTYSLGWQEIGKFMEVTKVENNRLYTLDNISAFEMYQKYLGPEISENLMNFAGAEFPIIVNRGGVKIAREATTKLDDNSIIYSGKIYPKEKIKFGYGNVNFILYNIKKIVNELTRINPESIFIYSCAARKAFLKEDILSEIEPISKFANTAGFFTYGEFFHLNNRNETLNMTMTLLCMSEKSFYTYKEIEKFSNEDKLKEYYHNKSMANIRALTHLVEVVTDELEEKNRILETQNHNILESINYAQKIQSAILPNLKTIQNTILKTFIIWKPRDIVGGDFYWFKKINNTILFSCIDCTGHGVPGAFMTMMTNSILHHIVDTICSDNPAEILKELNILVKRTLQKENSKSKRKITDDGLDIGLCLLMPNKKKLVFSGSKISLFYSDKTGSHEIKPDKQSIGYIRSKKDFEYTNHEIEINNDRIFYMTSDGLIDQNGSNNQNHFGKDNFLKLIEDIYKNNFDTHKEIILQKINNFMKNESQRDDITILGFKI